MQAVRRTFILLLRKRNVMNDYQLKKCSWNAYEYFFKTRIKEFVIMINSQTLNALFSIYDT